MFQFDVILLGKKQKHAREDLLQYVFHTLGTKAIDGSEIRTLFLAIHMNDILATSVSARLCPHISS